MTAGERIKEIREKIGLTEGEFWYEILKYPEEAGKGWEREDLVPQQVLNRVCLYYGLRPEWVINGEGQPSESKEELEHAKDVADLVKLPPEAQKWIVRFIKQGETFIRTFLLLTERGNEAERKRQECGIPILPGCENKSVWDVTIMYFKAREEQKEWIRTHAISLDETYFRMMEMLFEQLVIAEHENETATITTNRSKKQEVEERVRKATAKQERKAKKAAQKEAAAG